MRNMLDGLVSFIYGCIAQEMGIILKHEGIMIWVGKQLIIFQIKFHIFGLVLIKIDLEPPPPAYFYVALFIFLDYPLFSNLPFHPPQFYLPLSFQLSSDCPFYILQTFLPSPVFSVLGTFPNDNFPSGNFPNVQFPKRQLPTGQVRPSEAPKAAMRDERRGLDGLGGRALYLGPTWEVAAPVPPSLDIFTFPCPFYLFQTLSFPPSPVLSVQVLFQVTISQVATSQMYNFPSDNFPQVRLGPLRRRRLQ